MTADTQIVAPDGSLATKGTTILDQAEVDLLRSYKKFLSKYGLREALYCGHCWDNNLSDGCNAHVTDSQVMIECRCRVLFHQ